MTARSPRTATEPMAFSGVEFARGAVAAGLWSMLFAFVGWTVAAFPWGLFSLAVVIPAGTRKAGG